MGFYSNFTIEEAIDIGAKFKAKCHAPYNYLLTKDKIYEIEITPRILTMSPLCKFIDDTGKNCEAHLTRFTKIENEDLEFRLASEGYSLNNN